MWIFLFSTTLKMKEMWLYDDFSVLKYPHIVLGVIIQLFDAGII